MLFTILTFLTGLAGPAATIIGKLSDNKAAMALASTEKERQEILAAIEELNARKQVLIAEAGSRINTIIRGAFAFIAFSYIWKLIFWDKVVGSFWGQTIDIFTTDPLDPYLWSIVMTIICFYFLALWKRSS